MRIATTLAALFAALAAMAGGAHALTWTESGDAGDTPDAPQVVRGGGVLDAIDGRLDPDFDTDVYGIVVADPAAFSISMDGTALGVDNDTMLWVLAADGTLLFVNDDRGPGTGADDLLSALRPGEFAGHAAGYYLVAYNLYDSVPLGVDTVVGWQSLPDPSQTGTVRLAFTGARFVGVPNAVPEPASPGLAALGLAAAALARRRAQVSRVTPGSSQA